MRLPIKHLSARVPWHDRRWDGSVCDNPLDNSFCRVLPMIDAVKDVEFECTYCKEKFCDMGSLPPCASEKASFMSPFEYHRILEHSYKIRGNKLFKDFLPAIFPFGFGCFLSGEPLALGHLAHTPHNQDCCQMLLWQETYMSWQQETLYDFLTTSYRKA